MQWHGAPFLLLMFMVAVQPFVRPRTWSSACSVTASRRKGFKRPKISHICTVLKSFRTHTKNKLIIHPSTVYFLIMHTNPNLKHLADQRIVKPGGEGESRSSATSPCGYTPAWYSRVRTRCSATVGEEFVSGTGVPMVAGGRQPRSDHGSEEHDPSRGMSGDWLPNTVCIRSLDMGLDRLGQTN
jgi:hypothetical protein